MSAMPSGVEAASTASEYEKKHESNMYLSFLRHLIVKERTAGSGKL